MGLFLDILGPKGLFLGWSKIEKVFGVYLYNRTSLIFYATSNLDFCVVLLFGAPMFFFCVLLRFEFIIFGLFGERDYLLLVREINLF